MPLSIVTSNLVRFGVQMVLLISMMIYFAATGASIQITPAILLFPVLVLLMAFQGLGIGLMITAMTTKYRDLSFLVQFGVQLLMYVTTVIYPLSSAPPKYKWLIELNPMTVIIESFRYAFLGKGEFTAAGLAYSALITLVLMVLGVVTFNKTEKNFVDTV
jgi:lipopolysaccharide transport system permease protein